MTPRPVSSPAARDRLDALERVHQPRSGTNHRCFTCGEWSPCTVAALVAEVRALRDENAAVRALHQPENRYSDSGREWSCDTPEEAAAVADCDPSELVVWQVCAECGRIERADEDDRDWAYRESLWPCRTARALDAEEVTE